MDEEIKLQKVYQIEEIFQKGWLGLSRMSIMRLINKGGIQGTDLNVTGENKRYGIKGEEILRFIKSREIKVK